MKIIYVATDGNDTTGNGAQLTPYASIDRAILDFVSGDQIRIMDGVYVTEDSVVISGVDGSIFAENPNAVYIQPEKTTKHQACLAILDAGRFSTYGLNILQASNNSGNLIGIYAENVSNFLCFTCAVSDFEIPSGNGYGIFASGSGRIEHCTVENIKCSGPELFGIKTLGIEIIDCTAVELSGSAECAVTALDENGLWP